MKKNIWKKSVLFFSYSVSNHVSCNGNMFKQKYWNNHIDSEDYSSKSKECLGIAYHREKI